MKISGIISLLTALAEEHGDIDVVHGLACTGYGNLISEATVVEGVTFEGDSIKVIDLEIDESSLVSVGPW